MKKKISKLTKHKWFEPVFGLTTLAVLLLFVYLETGPHKGSMIVGVADRKTFTETDHKCFDRYPDSSATIVDVRVPGMGIRRAMITPSDLTYKVRESKDNVVTFVSHMKALPLQCVFSDNWTSHGEPPMVELESFIRH